MRRCKVNENVFDEINETSAYWIGFLMADGCIVTSPRKPPCVNLRISNIDHEHVKKFRNFLESTHKIGIYKNNGFKGNDLCCLQFSSSKLVRSLEKHGVTKRKSLTAKASDELKHNKHFWRGMIDGDGYIYLTTNNHLPAIGLCGSECIVKQFETFSKTICPECKANPRHKKIWQFQTSGESAYKIISELYKEQTLSLNRKQVLANGILAKTWDRERQNRSEITYEKLVHMHETIGDWESVAASLGIKRSSIFKLLWRKKNNKH
jgi:hypothetical protein